MSPEERRLLAELFERTREAAMHPRDREAEALIAELVRGQPAAPYLLAQAVLVQEQALKAADAKMQDMEAEIAHLDGLLREQEAAASQNRPGGGFLGSIFGGGEPPREAPRQPPRGAVPPSGGVWGSGRTLDQGQGGYGQGGMGQGGMSQGGMGMAPQQGGPWAGQRQAAPAPQQGGGGFLSGALTTAAGVAGGMLLANSVKGLFGGHSDPLGMGAKAGEAPRPAGDAGGSITDGVPGYGSGRMTEAQQREQDRLQDEDQDQDMEQDEEGYGDDDDGGGYDDE